MSIITKASPDPMTVAVVGDEDLTQGICAYLRRTSHMQLLPRQRLAMAEMLLVVAHATGANLLRELRTVTSSAGHRQRAVLIAETVHESHLSELISCGVVSILPLSEVTANAQLISKVLIASRDGGAVLPNDITRRLIDDARAQHTKILLIADRVAAVFSPREIDVLRLLAEGHDTVEIAKRLNYSARTIKKVIYGMLARFDLRNRAHAVSFAIRVGAI